MNRIGKLVWWGLVGAVAVVHFYTPLSIALYSNFGHRLFVKGWREALLVGMVLVAAVWAFSRRRILVQAFDRRVVLLAGLMLILIVLQQIFHSQNLTAFLGGAIIYLRPFAFFMLAQLVVITGVVTRKRFDVLLRIILVCAAVVMGFGALQVTVLPKDILKHVGYSQTSTPPYLTIDNNENNVRILSTTRGPNPFAAYIALILPLLIVVCLALPVTKQRKVLYLSGIFIVAAVSLYGTKSRSGVLATILALVTFGFLRYKIYQSRYFYRAALLCTAFSVAGVLSLQHTPTFQKYVFHRDPGEAGQVNSDDQRLSSLTLGIQDIREHPLGRGVGTVGPASLYNTKGVRITENFYIQTAQELSLVGLVILVTFLGLIGWRLWLLQRGGDPVVVALIAGLVAIVAANLFLPALSDELMATVWWVCAGAVLQLKRSALKA